MPQRFCAICGNKIDEKAPHFGMCIGCYLKENPLFELPPTYRLRICLDCNRYSKKEEWIKSDKMDFLLVIDDAIYNILIKPFEKNDLINFSIDIDKNKLEFSSKDLINSLEAKVTGRLKDNTSIFSEQTIRISINYDLCNNCMNLRSGTHFTSILQLRVKNSNYFDTLNKILDQINNYVHKEFVEDDRQYISKIIDQKNGLDIYLSTNELMNHIISYLKSRYHFLLKRSKKLVGRDHQRGKGIYRLKALIRFIPIKKRDTIIINNQKFIVEQILKNKVILKNKNNIKLIKDFNYFFEEK
ncbi:MAG: NMD3-related protein [Candidatus Lokiarchaeota archaeon]|jgi:NMD protein affecting ribosome stability and mRNA decay